MAARRHYTVLLQPSLAMASLGERHYSTKVTTWTYLGCLGFGWMHRQGHPRARWFGGESTTALSIMFNTGEAMAHREVIT